MTKKRKRIALFTSQIEGDYCTHIWESIHIEASKQEMDLVIYPGNHLTGDAGTGTAYNEVFNFFNCNKFDGIILSSSSLMNYVGKDVLCTFMQKFITLPIVSLSVDIGICSSITVNNFSGMKALATHLVNHHDCSRFAYLSGTKENPECAERLSGFKAGLKEKGIFIDEKNIFHGDFNKLSVAKGLAPLFDRDKMDLDVIACANDLMAVGVIELLKERGYLVPQDIKVTGFDHSLTTRLQSPTITTIAHPIDEMARESVILLAELIDSNSQQNKHVVKESFPIIRGSCGCMEYPETIKLNELSNLPTVTEHHTKILQLINQDIKTTLYSDKKHFISVNKIYDMLEKHDHGIDCDFLRNITFEVIAKLKSDATGNRYNAIEMVAYQLITLFNNYEVNVQLQKLDEREQTATNFRVIEQDLLSSKSLESLYQSIDELFFVNKIHSYYIILRDTDSNSDALQLKHAKQNGTLIDCNKNPILFKKEDFIPDELLPKCKHTTLFSQSLFYQNKYFGYLITEVKPIDGWFYSNMQMLISGALKNIATLEKRTKTEKALSHSLKDLKKTQEMLVESEKLAALGNIVAGLAHEINTPIGTTVTASSYLKETIESLNGSYLNSTISKKSLESFFHKVSGCNDLIEKNLKRTVELIDRFKLISTTHAFENKRNFKLYTLVSDIVKNEVKNNNIKTNINITPHLTLHSYPGILSQILIHLLENSITHGFKELDSGIIDISAEVLNNNLIITYADNGHGCLIEELADIYAPFFTTMRKTGHTGLGLTIVYNLLKHKLRGTIEVNSQDNLGLEFKMVIPLSESTN